MSNQASYQTHTDDNGIERVFLGWFDHMCQPILGSWRGHGGDLNDDNGRGSTPFLSNGVALEGQAIGMRPSLLVETYGEENLLVVDVLGPQAVFVSETRYNQLHSA